MAVRLYRSMTLLPSTLYHNTTGRLEVVGLIDLVRNYRPLKATTPLPRTHKFRGITIVNRLLVLP